MNKTTYPWCFILHVFPETDLDEAWEMLQKAGLKPLYIEEDPDKVSKIYITADSEHSIEGLLKRFAFIEYIDLEEMGDVNWVEQWKIHGINFRDGHVLIDVPEALSPSWRQLKLMPGAGFGDLSHPTTRIMMRMMKHDVSDQYVVDIGCGSGVLALCAVALGAKHVFAIDIDELALKHSKENAALNGMENKLSFYLPEEFQLPADVKAPVILMNMILTEQQNAWAVLKSLHCQKGICFASGILAEEKQEYIKLVKEWGWTICEEQEEHSWIGYRMEWVGKST